MPFIGALSGASSRPLQPPAPQPLQTLRSSQGSHIQIRLFDSVTGYGIHLKSLDDVTLKSNLQEYRLPEGNEYNTLSVQAAQGKYDLNVAIDGYKRVQTPISIEEESTFEILLDPVQTPAELKEDYVNSLTLPNVATIIGYIVDDQTGRPLAKATAGLSDGTFKAKSNKRGFFILQVPVPPQNRLEDKPVLKNILFELQGYAAEERQYVQAFANQATVYRIRLKSGQGRNVIDERQHRNNAAAAWDEQPQTNNLPTDGSSVDESPKQDATKPPSEKSATSYQPTAVTVPPMIKVGTNCYRRDCRGQVLVMSLDNYCKRSLPREWNPQWDMNSLKAGAVAIRSYAAWFVNHPISPNYDICSNTYCQGFGDSTTPATDRAVDETTRVVLADGNDNIVQSEYSREHNNTTCGNCYTGQCIADAVCCGDSGSGHGRGMCQQGSQRWATGTKFGSPGNPVPSGNPPQDWMWILNHYYPNYRIVGISNGARPVVSSSLRLSSGPPYYVGQTIYGYFTIINRGSQAITFSRLLIGGRLNGDQSCASGCPDFSSAYGVTLSPGQSFSYSGSQLLSRPGNYSFFVAYQKTDGTWVTNVDTDPGVSKTLAITVQNSSPPGSFNLTATPECNGSNGQIRLNWAVSNGAQSYDIYREGSLYVSNYTGTQFINTLVTPGIRYSYYIRAKNSAGSTPSNTVQVTVPTNCGGSSSANLQISFSPNPVFPNQAAGCSRQYDFTVILRETNGVGLNITRVDVDQYQNLTPSSLGLPTHINGNAQASSGISYCRGAGGSTWRVTGTDDRGRTNTWTGILNLQ
jgi:Sporulation protein and related proteins